MAHIERFSNYYIEALFMFKKIKLAIISVYIPPNDKSLKKEIQQQVIRRIKECERDQIEIILMGDFNNIRSTTLDQSNETSNRMQKLPLLK